MEKLLKKHAEKIRFIIVGGANTALDFGILFFLTFVGVDKFVANYFSNGIALIFSFFANKTFTFKHKSKNAKKEFILFLVITLIGLWIIQPIVIWGAIAVLTPYIENDAINLFVAKLIATVASLIWNYFLYSRVVFKKSTETEI